MSLCRLSSPQLLHFFLGPAEEDQVALRGVLGGSDQMGWWEPFISSPSGELRGEARANERQLSLLWSQQTTDNVMKGTSGTDQWHINNQNMYMTRSHRRNGSVSYGCDLIFYDHIFIFLSVIFNSLVLSTVWSCQQFGLVNRFRHSVYSGPGLRCFHQ